MKKINFRNIKFKRVKIQELDSRTLLLNLYITQLLTFAIAAVVIFFQQQNFMDLLHIEGIYNAALWGIGLGAAVLLFNWIVGRWVPEHVTDDGGLNQMLFESRPLWHIAVIALVVSICEELLFRGAIQYHIGPYWTSIIFAAIHIRYLQHWLMTGLVFSISYALGWIYVQTGTLWAPIIAHFIIDFVMGCIIRYRRES